MSEEYISKFSGEEIDEKLEVIKSDQGENTVLHGDGTYKPLPEPTVTDEQVATAVKTYVEENPISSAETTMEVENETLIITSGTVTVDEENETLIL